MKKGIKGINLKHLLVVVTVFFTAAGCIAFPAKTEASETYLLDEQWKSLTGWTTSGAPTVEITQSDYLHLRDTENNVTNAYKTSVSIPPAYVLEFRAKVNSYSMAVLPNNKIGLLYERGEATEPNPIYFAKFNLEWLTNGSDYIGAAPTQTPASIPPAAPVITPYFTDIFNSLSSAWTVVGNATYSSADNSLKLQSNNASNTRAYRTDVNVPSVYKMKFSPRTYTYAPGIRGDGSISATMGIKACDGTYRLMLSIKQDGIYAIDSTNNWKQVAAFERGNYWEDYTAEVNNGVAQIYRNGDPKPQRLSHNA